MTDDPVFAPPPDGADRVIAAARLRRRRKVSGLLSSVAAATVLVLGAVVVSGSPSGGADQLTVTDDPTATPSQRTSAAPVPNVVPSSRPQAGTTNRPSTASSGTGGETASSPPPSPPRSTARRVSPIRRSTRTIDDPTDLCDGGAGSLADWCIRTVDPGTVHRGHAVSLQGEMCRMRGATAATVTFDDTREVSLEVSDGSAVDWQSGEGLTYRKPGRTVTVQPGTCLVWSSVWDTRDRDGFLVPPGRYDFSLTILAEGAGYVGGTVLTVED